MLRCWPFCADRISGVIPSLSSGSIDAPDLIRAFVHPFDPLYAAQCNAVHPVSL